jgi:steroid delta-isomerase-like uncharacterized protein
MTHEEIDRALAVHLAAEQRGDIDEMVATMSTRCCRRQPGFGFYIEGRPSSSEYYAAWFPAFQPPGDVAPELGGRAYGENTVVLWMVVSLTMKKDFLGVKATNRTARLPMITVFTFRDGLVESETTHYDTADMCDQLGIDRQEMIEAYAWLAAKYSTPQTPG